MAFDAEQSAIEAARTTLTQSYQDRPNYADELREEIYGGEQALPSLRENRDSAIRGLYDADKRMADRYANQESDMFIKNPYAREKLMSAQHQTELGGVQDIMRMIESREDVLGDILSKGLDLYDYGLKAEEFEYNAMLKDLDNAMKIAEFNRKAAGSGSGSKMGLLDLKKALSGAWGTAVAPEDLVDREYTDADRFYTSPEGVSFEWDMEGGKWVKEDFGDIPTGWGSLWDQPDDVLSFLDAQGLGLAAAENIFDESAGNVETNEQVFKSDEITRYLGIEGLPVTPERQAAYRQRKDKVDKQKNLSFEDILKSGNQPSMSSSATITPTPSATPANQVGDLTNLLSSPYMQDMEQQQMAELQQDMFSDVDNYLNDSQGYTDQQAAQEIYNSFEGAIGYDEILTAIAMRRMGIR